MWPTPRGCSLLAACCLLAAGSITLAEGSSPGASHAQTGTINVDSSQQIATFCMDPQGRLLVAVTPRPAPRSAAATDEKPTVKSGGQVLVHNADGTLAATWDVPLTVQSINVAPDGTVFIAGGGQIARLDADGRVVKQAATPQMGEDAAAYRAKVREQLVESLKSRAQLYDRIIEQVRTQVTALQEKPEEERTATEKLRLKNAERQLASYEEMKARALVADPTEADVDQYLLSKLKVPGLAVSDRDVFVAVSSTHGYGYDVWRMDHNFYEPKEVAVGLRGCCGQMDIQCCRGDLYVAENSRHRVVRFDRNGSELAAWGSSDRTGANGFEGCCNPMNLRFGKDGEVLTAESGCGAIKRYTADGEFLGLLGNASLQGGCKHVAVAATPDASRVFMLDVTRSQIAVLEPAVAAAAESK